MAAADFTDEAPIGSADARPAAWPDHPAARPLPRKQIIEDLIGAIHSRGIRYCHWKSNIRLEETLAAAEDVDVLVDRRDAARFQAALAENGFKAALSRSGVDHPGVFHALGLDHETAELVDMHVFHHILSGDSLVKNYRLAIEDAVLDGTRSMHGVRVPAAEAELAMFVLRIALKHVSPVEILKANRRYGKISAELAWLRQSADADAALAFCRSRFPTIEPDLFRQLLEAIADDRAIGRRIVLGWRVAWRLRGIRRLGTVAAAASRTLRLASFILGRLRRRRDFALQTGGMVVALVGPKATGKSTIGRELAARLGRHLDVSRIHAGKPPATLLSFVPRLFVPMARSLLPRERLGEYEKPERRREKRYSLLYVLRMTLIAYERRKLLRRALRMATAGRIVISDRYPSEIVGAIDSCCFDEEALAKARSRLQRWLMRRECALYRGLPRPGLVLRLEAPMNTAIERDAARAKQGGPNAEAVMRRWELESGASFPGTPVVVIDTGQPLEESVRSAVRAVWAAL